MSVKTRTLKLGLVTAAAATGLALMAPVPAQADPVGCLTGHFCIYNVAENRKGELQIGVYDLAGWNGGVLNDNISWVWNLAGNNWCVYENAGYTGANRVVGPGYFGDLGGFGMSVSSLRERGLGGC